MADEESLFLENGGGQQDGNTNDVFFFFHFDFAVV